MASFPIACSGYTNPIKLLCILLIPTIAISSGGTVKPIVVSGVAGTNYYGIANDSVTFIYDFRLGNSSSFKFEHKSIRVLVKVDSPEEWDSDLPVTFFIRQNRKSFHWELPFVSIYDGLTYSQASRTLCWTNNVNLNFTSVDIQVMVSTSSTSSIPFQVLIDFEEEQLLHVNQVKTLKIKPFSSRFVVPNFTTDYALIKVTSPDTNCATLVVMDAICPKQDEEDNLVETGYRQTMTTKAGMILMKERFPNGVNVGFIMHGSHAECVSKDPDDSNQMSEYSNKNITQREKMLEIAFLEIENTAWYKGVWGTIAIAVAFCSVVLLFPKFLVLWNMTINKNNRFENWISKLFERCQSQTGATEDAPLLSGSIDFRPDREDERTHFNPICNNEGRNKIIFLDEVLRKLRDNGGNENPVDIAVLERKSHDYWKIMLISSLFCLIPATMLLWSYVSRILDSGETDLCYYNNLCAFPHGPIHDFNHLFSNGPYIILGVLFLVVTETYRRDHQERLKKAPNRGIPRFFGLFYAMGFSLILEGVFSGMYHLCPSRIHFQFDTLFMYVMIVTCMMRIYESRRLDIKLAPLGIFGMLACAALFNFVGIFGETVRFYALYLFPALYASCFLLVYTYLRLDIDPSDEIPGTLLNPIPANNEDICYAISQPFRNYWRDFKCFYENTQGFKKFVLWLVANYLLVYLLVFLYDDLATTTLFLLMINAIFTFVEYTFKKHHITSKEKRLGGAKESPFRWRMSILYALTISLWGASCYFFFQFPIAWYLSPAGSRTKNFECYHSTIFDTHDIWHLLSAFALFFTFMILLVVDDDLQDVEQSKIRVF